MPKGKFSKQFCYLPVCLINVNFHKTLPIRCFSAAVKVKRSG